MAIAFDEPGVAFDSPDYSFDGGSTIAQLTAGASRATRHVARDVRLKRQFTARLRLVVLAWGEVTHTNRHAATLTGTHAATATRDLEARQVIRRGHSRALAGRVACVYTARMTVPAREYTIRVDQLDTADAERRIEDRAVVALALSMLQDR